MSWLDDPLRRAKTELPDLRYEHQQRKAGPVDLWTASVLIDHDVRRVVTIEFDRRSPSRPNVYADGPTLSPHRYRDRGRTTLCLWLPGDKPERRWQVDDGLLALFGIAAHHLFKEAWWRDTDEWLGAEAAHGDDLRTQTPASTGRGERADPAPTERRTRRGLG